MTLRDLIGLIDECDTVCVLMDSENRKFTADVSTIMSCLGSDCLGRTVAGIESRNNTIWIWTEA